VPILKNITDSGLRLPPYCDSIFDGTGEARMHFGPSVCWMMIRVMTVIF